MVLELCNPEVLWAIDRTLQGDSLCINYSPHQMALNGIPNKPTVYELCMTIPEGHRWNYQIQIEGEKEFTCLIVHRGYIRHVTRNEKRDGVIFTRYNLPFLDALSNFTIWSPQGECN